MSPGRVDDCEPAARRLVALLAGARGGPAGGARAAIAAGLGGMYARGVAPGALDEDTITALRSARRREAYDDAASAAEIGAILDRLAVEGLAPVVLKGRLLAEELWPEPSLRPAGDLDLLLAPDELARAERALREDGFRPAPVEAPARLPSATRDALGVLRGAGLRRAPTGVELVPPPGRRVGVDLHARPFRSVGHRVAPADLLARARPATLCGRAVRSLDEPDRLLFLLVHAAKHGLVEPKWIVDLDLALARASSPTLDATIDRARAARLERPAWAALRVLSDEAHVPVPARALDTLRPPPPWPPVISRLVTARALADAPTARGSTAARRYALEIALEPGLAARARLAAGLVERLVRSPRSGGVSFP